jgi:hypothetical protein
VSGYRVTVFRVEWETREDQPEPTVEDVHRALRTLSPWSWRDELSGPENERPRGRVVVTVEASP